MTRFLVAYGTTAAVFLLLDFIWLNYAAANLYRPRLGALLLESPSLVIAAVFYLVYAAAIVVLAVLPGLRADSWSAALGLAAILGVAAYGTYDITNLATIRGWSGAVTVIDLAWGTLVTGLAAVGGFFATRAIVGAGLP